MALAPAPTKAIPGVRIYPGQPEVSDKTERGAFVGERRETVTYLLQEPGTLELPALTYLWWDPKSEALRSKTLPAVTIEVAPSSKSSSPAESTTDLQRTWPWLIAAVGLIALTAWQRQCIAKKLARYWKTLNPPEGRAARKLLAACRHHDPTAAQDAWNQWRLTQDRHFLPPPALQASVLDMQRHLFGPSTTNSWRGDALAKALAAHRSEARSATSAQQRSVLPLLNSR
jgi:hypothetical protein